MTKIDYEKLISQWHKDRNLIDGSTDKDQFMKLLQEVGELSDSLCKGKDFRDDVGDIMVVLINILVRNGVTIDECLEIAYNDIKDRKGKKWLMEFLSRKVMTSLDNDINIQEIL